MENRILPWNITNYFVWVDRIVNLLIWSIILLSVAFWLLILGFRLQILEYSRRQTLTKSPRPELKRYGKIKSWSFNNSEILKLLRSSFFPSLSWPVIHYSLIDQYAIRTMVCVVLTRLGFAQTAGILWLECPKGMAPLIRTAPISGRAVPSVSQKRIVYATSYILKTVNFLLEIWARKHLQGPVIEWFCSARVLFLCCPVETKKWKLTIEQRAESREPDSISFLTEDKTMQKYLSIWSIAVFNWWLHELTFFLAFIAEMYRVILAVKWVWLDNN